MYDASRGCPTILSTQPLSVVRSSDLFEQMREIVMDEMAEFEDVIAMVGDDLSTHGGINRRPRWHRVDEAKCSTYCVASFVTDGYQGVRG